MLLLLEPKRVFLASSEIAEPGGGGRGAAVDPKAHSKTSVDPKEYDLFSETIFEFEAAIKTSFKVKTGEKIVQKNIL